MRWLARWHHWCNGHEPVQTLGDGEWQGGLACYSPYGLFATPWTVAYQAPQSMEFFRQEYWSGLPFPYCLASMAFMLLWQLSSTGISHHSLLPHIP